MELFRRLSEGLARRTTRRGLFGRGAQAATGALLGVAAGTLTRPEDAQALHLTLCSFPGAGCPCDGCNEGGTCAKPCTFNTTWYASGCWVTAGVTCCDCACNGMPNDIDPLLNHREIGTPMFTCGCGSDFQGDPKICP